MWHPVIKLDEIPDGSSREFIVGDRIVALFRDGDSVWAMDGICPHAGGPLGEGVLQNGIVTCPWHGWQFDVATGAHCLTPQIRQTCFAVTIQDGRVNIEIP